MASLPKKRSSNKEVFVEGTQDPDGWNDQEPENSGSSEKSSATKKRIKHRKTCQESRKRIKARNDKLATDRNKYKEEIIRLRAQLDMVKDLAPNMLAEPREDNRHRREDVETETDLVNKLFVLLAKRPQPSGTTKERDSTSASTEVTQVNETFQSLLVGLGTIRLAYDKLDDRYAASEARNAQEIAALRESHAKEIAALDERHKQEVATIKMEHKQELEEVRAREQDLTAQLQSLSFDPCHDWSNDN